MDIIGIVSSLLGPYLTPILTGLGALLGLAMTYFFGKSSGKTEMKKKSAEEALKREQLRNEIDRKPVTDADAERMRNRYSRD